MSASLDARGYERGKENLSQGKRKGDITMSVPVITLNSGIRIANFSSPHSFKFDTGEVLEACSPERANTLMLSQREHEDRSPCGRYTNISLTFEMSDVVRDELLRLEEDENIDIVLVPFPVMEALKASNLRTQISKARVCRTADRVTKTVYHNKFCI